MTQKTGACAFAALVALATASYADTPSNEELYRTIQRQQAQIDALAERAAAAPDDEGIEIESYGELHYNHNDGGDDQIDFHRFTLALGHAFNDKWRVFSEVELEHAFSETTEVEFDEDTGAVEEVERTPGEVELEQAWIEVDLGQRHAARAGLDLIPVGIINETHEPNTFYGVERNRVESRIVPTTWWAGGVKLIGRPNASGLSYTLFVHEGMAMEAEPDFSIHDGRQKTAEAVANDFATTGRIKYTGVPGLELAASLQYQSDVSQQPGDGLDDALLFETHMVYAGGPFGLRALYAQWDINGPVAAANRRDRQYGWYVEPSFRPHPRFGVFARYAELEETENLAENDTTVGFNYWPIHQVVIKADYQWRETDLANGGTLDENSFNVGLGYVFD